MRWGVWFVFCVLLFMWRPCLIVCLYGTAPATVPCGIAHRVEYKLFEYMCRTLFRFSSCYPSAGGLGTPCSPQGIAPAFPYWAHLVDCVTFGPSSVMTLSIL